MGHGCGYKSALMTSCPMIVARPWRVVAGPMPKGAQRLSVDSPDGETLVGIHIPAAAKSVGQTLGPGFRRQCLERPGRRRLSARNLSGGGRRRLPLSRLSAVDGQPVGRSLARRRAVGLRCGGRAREAGADRRGRLQHRQRRRRKPCQAPTARRPDPRHAVRFAEGGRAGPLSLAADRPLLPA